MKLSAVLRQWGITSYNATRIKKGVSTQNWKIESGNQTFILRNAGSFLDYINFQQQFIQHVKQNGFSYSLPLPINTLNQDPLYIHENRGFWLYKYICGKDKHLRLSCTLASKLGSMVGQLHTFGSTFNYSGFSQLRSRNLFEQETIKSSLRETAKNLENQKSTTFVKMYLNNIEKIISSYESNCSSEVVRIYNEQQKIPCHGDLKFSNILSKDSSLVGLIDFGGVVIEPRIFDVQFAIFSLFFKQRNLQWKYVKCFLEGYQNYSLLSAADISIIPAIAICELTNTVNYIYTQKSLGNTRILPSIYKKKLSILITLIDNQSYFNKKFNNLRKS